MRIRRFTITMAVLAAVAGYGASPDVDVPSIG
jgi:hypothetical protein